MALQNLNNNDQAYLYGSRVDDAKRGGDIDLLIYSQQDSFPLSRKITLEFYKHCEEKIDVLVINPEKITEEQNLFIQSIIKQKLTLL